MSLTRDHIEHLIKDSIDEHGVVDIDVAVNFIMDTIREHLEMQPYEDDLYTENGDPVTFHVDRDFDLMWTV